MSAHLTSIWLDEREAAHQRLFDTYDWHQAAWKCFPGRDDTQRDFLTRLDARDGGFRLFIVSPLPPARPAWCEAGEWRTKEIPASYFQRRRYCFQLRANPTRKVRADGPDGTRKKNGRRQALTQPEALREWLQRKGATGGFRVEGLEPQSDTPCAIAPARRFYFHREKDGQRGLHAGVDFTGRLEVIDPALFHETFRAGIGSAKSFGFGLLIIAPA